MSSTLPVYVVTCPVPPGSGTQIRVVVDGHTVTAVGPHGFRQTFELPPDAAAARLEWLVYADILELRAPLHPRARSRTRVAR